AGEWYNGAYTVCLREVATLKEIRRWWGHRNNVSSLAFSPDGRTLASGSWDTRIFVWDVPAQQERAAARPGRKELEALWEDLGAGGAAKGCRAGWRLAAAPEEAVPFLAGRLRPAPVADAQHIARLVRDLDSEEFTKREAASAELARFGEATR